MPIRILYFEAGFRGASGCCVAGRAVSHRLARRMMSSLPFVLVLVLVLGSLGIVSRRSRGIVWMDASFSDGLSDIGVAEFGVGLERVAVMGAPESWLGSLEGHGLASEHRAER